MKITFTKKFRSYQPGETREISSNQAQVLIKLSVATPAKEKIQSDAPPVPTPQVSVPAAPNPAPPAVETDQKKTEDQPPITTKSTVSPKADVTTKSDTKTDSTKKPVGRPPKQGEKNQDKPADTSKTYQNRMLTSEKTEK